MTSALIGHTGFVGGSLLPTRRWSAAVNSRNAASLDGARFDDVVCAGAPGTKWRANLDPDEDGASTKRLMGTLGALQARHLTLISTVDVFETPRGKDENDPAEPGDVYGRNRLEIERFVASRFPDHLIVRLPALFGPGLRKNALFDLLQGERLAEIDAGARFQWYPLARLPTDLASARQAGLRLAHLVTEPLAMADLIGALFPHVPLRAGAVSRHYDLRTRHAGVFASEGHYLMPATAVLGHLARFAASWRTAA